MAIEAGANGIKVELIPGEIEDDLACTCGVLINGK
jgi:hypothetical protein